MNDISFTRGDTKIFEINIEHSDGSPYEVQADDKLVLTVKKSTADEEIVLQKMFQDNQIVIEHDDTKSLACMTYVYDVQLTQNNGYVSTVIKPSKFIIESEVNYDWCVEKKNNY